MDKQAERAATLERDSSILAKIEATAPHLAPMIGNARAAGLDSPRGQGILKQISVNATHSAAACSRLTVAEIWRVCQWNGTRTDGQHD